MELEIVTPLIAEMAGTGGADGDIRADTNETKAFQK